MRRPASAALLLLFLAFSPAAARGEDPPPLLLTSVEIVPVPRPASPPGTFPIGQFLKAESEYQAGRAPEALSRFLDLAYNAPDDERKGFAWLRVGEMLFAKGDAKEALSAADKAALLLRGRYLVLSAMDLKLRVYQRLRWKTESRQVAGYLLDQKFLNADAAKLLAMMARAASEEGKSVEAFSLYRRAIAANGAEGEAATLRAERDALVEGMTDIPAIRDAAEAEEEGETRAHLFLSLGRTAARKGFLGMGAWALEKAARGGGAKGREAAEQLFRIEKIMASRPKIVGLVPLGGKLSDIGFAVLSGAEVALQQARRRDPDGSVPAVRWVDTGGQPDRARKEFSSAASDRSVIGFLGPVTGEEGRSVGVAFGPKSPPVLYLGQKAIPEKPFLYGFGLSPQQEAKAVLAHLRRSGSSSILLFHPENGYGQGFAEAVSGAAKEAGVRVARTVSYPPDVKDFTGVIRKAVGNAVFAKQSKSKAKGDAMKLPLDGIVVADRWDRVFLLASQLRFYNVYLPLAGFSGWNDAELIRKGGDAVAGSVFSVDYADAVPGTQGEKFRQDFQEAMRAAPSRFEAMGYDGALLLIEAYGLEVHGRDQRNSSRQAAGEATRERIPRLRTFTGVTGHFQFGPSGEMRRKVFLLKVDLGNFVPVPDTVP